MVSIVNKDDFIIDGWFPPCSYISAIDGKKYACCGSNCVEIPLDMTMEEIMIGWICTAPAYVTKEKVEKTYKKPTKKDLIAKILPTKSEPRILVEGQSHKTLTLKKK